MTATAISLRDVGKVFASGVRALDGLSLDIGEGEFVTLLGPSGCGKSTALRIIAGLAAPSQGEVLWPEQQGARVGEIGFVFQEPTLMPWADVSGNVALPLALSRVDSLQAKLLVGAALERVGLNEFAHSLPRELSGGMKMRVSIARALVTNPKLLLMDEPFAALDELTRFKLNNDVLALWRSLRPTIVFVTHSVFESVYLSSRIIVMTSRPGRVYADIPIEAPYPRADFRTSMEYGVFCRRVSEALEQAAEARP